MAPPSKELLAFGVRAAACRRVFIVEDDEVLRNGLRRGLHRLGYEVCGEAASGEAALAQIPAVRPDVVVMDVGLSTAVNGVAVAEQLRSSVDVPIVFLTGTTDAATVKLAAETSFAYVVKPVDAQTLAANLEVATTKHAAELRLRQARAELELVNAKLRDSEERYRSLFEEAIEGVFRMRLDGTIVAANPAFARIAGYESADELLGTAIHALFACPEEAQRICAGEVIDGNVLAWDTRAGKPITVVLFGRVLRDEFFQGFVRDVTEIRERKASEHAAREANRAKTHFLANMSHELRTPLNAILGLSDALLQRTYGELTDKQERSLHTVHASGRHLLDLIKDMLDVARIEAGQFPIAMQDVSLEPIVRESIAFAIEAAEAKRLRVTTTLDPSIRAVRTDPRRLKQVLINLLTNAIKFSRDGGTIAVAARHLANGTAELSVADSGPGIAPGDRERVFEPFVSLDGSMTSAGLGLALVKRIVELQGDSVRIEDAPTGGACLVVTMHVKMHEELARGRPS